MTTTCLNLFVYGSLREGFHNHRFLEEAGARRRPGIFHTADGFRMLDLGSFPALLRSPPLDVPTSCCGEVYELPDEAAFAPFDQLEGHPTFYCREVITVGNPGLDIVNAWVYLLVDSPRNEHISKHGKPVASGDWKAHAEGRR